VYMSTVHHWVRKSTAQWQKFGPEWPATVWKACHHNIWFAHGKSRTYSRKLTNFSEVHSRKDKHWFTWCQWDYSRFRLQKS
jgi:hypothetical protein